MRSHKNTLTGLALLFVRRLALLLVLTVCGFLSSTPSCRASDYDIFINGLTSNPSPVPAGSQVTFTIDIFHPNDGVTWGYIDYGDGTHDDIGNGDTEGPSTWDTTYQTWWIQEWFFGGVIQVTHTYASPGVYNATVFMKDDTNEQSGYPFDTGLEYYFGLGKLTQPVVVSAPVDKFPKKPGQFCPCDGSVCWLTGTGDAADTTIDPAVTRGFPLGNTITVNTQTIETTRAMDNATFTYDMHVATPTVYAPDGTGSTHWVAVDSTGRQIDFGPITSAPSPGPGVFSELSAFYSGSTITGYTLSNAGAPGDILEAGNYQYTFNSGGQLTQIQDPNGNTQSLDYSGGNLVEVVDNSTGKSISFSYSGSNISSITQNGGLEVTYLNYSSSGSLSYIFIEDGSGDIVLSKSYGYYPDGSLESVTKDFDYNSVKTFSYQALPATDGTTVLMANTNSEGPRTSYVYDITPSSGAATAMDSYNANGGVEEFEFDCLGDITQDTLPTPIGGTGPIVKTYSYSNRKPVSVNDGLTTTYYSYTSNGLMTSMTDGLSDEWSWGYSGSDLTSSQNPVQLAAGVSETIAYGDTSQPHVPTTVTDALGQSTSLGHNSHGQITTITPPSGSQTGTTTIAYDETSGSSALGLPTSITDGAGDLLTYNSYDSLGDPLSITTYPVPGNTSVQDTTQVSYDAAQRPLAITHPNGSVFENHYTGRNLDYTIDEASTQYNYSYCSPCGAPTGISGPLGWSLGWTYDSDMDLTEFTDARANTTVYTYGNAKELKEVTYPDSTDTQYLYNNGGNVRAIVNGTGHEVDYGYDGAERLDSITYPDSSTPAVAYYYNADDTLHYYTDGAGTTTYAYLLNGSVQSVKYDYTGSGEANVQELDYTYYPDGLTDTLTWKNGTATVGTWTYGYDAAGDLTSVTNPWGETTYWAYDGERKPRIQNNANGTRTRWCFDNGIDWPSEISQNHGTTKFASYALTYDAGADTVGNLTDIAEQDGSTVTYAYDALYRLTSEVRTGTASDSHTYGYDLAGNPTTIDGSTYTYDAANKLTSGTYDNDGNLTANGSASYTWDDEDRMTSAGSTDYVYDGQDHRVGMTAGSSTTYYIFDGDLLLGEVSASGTVNAGYTWGAAGLVSERLPASSKSLWYHFGPQGETRQLTDATGAVADTYNYTAYGQPNGTSGSDVNPFRYGGEVGYYSGSTGQPVLCTYRWYDPSTGRWLSRDPNGYDGGDDLYAYTIDNPTRYTDDNGLAGKGRTNVGDSRGMAGLQQALQVIIDTLNAGGLTQPERNALLKEKKALEEKIKTQEKSDKTRNQNKRNNYLDCPPPPVYHPIPVYTPIIEVGPQTKQAAAGASATTIVILIILKIITGPLPVP